MKKKIRFFQSVNFKIAIAFILLLLISIEIIGAYFIRELEQNTITDFENLTNAQVESLAKNLTDELEKSDVSRTEANENIRKVLDDFVSSDTLEARVVDDRGLVRATTDLTKQNDVGKKNDLKDLNDFSNSRKKEIIDSGKRVWINIEPIYSSTGTTPIGVLYVRSNIESRYNDVNDVALIFFTASLIAGAVSIVVAVLIARSITRPIDEMKEQALRIARGDYSGKVKVYGQDELGQLAETFNALSEQIEETQDAMEAERNRLDSVLSHMNDGVIATDRRGKVIIINEMAMDLLSVTSEEALGQSILKLLDIEEDYTLRKLLEEPGEILIDFAEKEISEDFILKVDFSMIRRESGFISGLVCVLHDVTEQEKNEKERRDFVSNVSHELRTPLTSMRSYIEALSDGAWENPEVAPSFLKVTLEETDRMIRMINDLLNLSRMDAGNTQLQTEYVNFNELVNFVLDRFDMIVQNEEDPRKKYVIKREFTTRALWVEVDTDKIIQVLDNIMNNAIKYSPDGGVITCTLIETHNNVIFSVRDQGLGIPKKDLNKIFERFYRVDKARSRAQGGTGLGLAISKEVMKAHGGDIWVTSEEGRGSAFYISLPYEPYEEDWWE
ncbi:cell wall metabolism sensor histidine kinase WalK [Enterococcus nangangensis]|uniref:cell wall metabolism sensor histidine kinase WalK n=1 Tax=Enterococcus nangangensis TaxID=2559926 RepID=UPI0010F5C043|nr:cell wall metabolism sensor histidine kinase WalK [Enterococcus nangangensis]